MIYDDLRGSNKILISGTHVLRAISLCMLYRKIPEKTCALLLQFFFCCSFSFATGEMDFFFQVVVEADGV